MRRWSSLVLSLLLLALFAASSSRVTAANITDLADAYSGPAHSLSDPELEDTNFGFEVDNVQSNGKFEMLFGTGARLPGKVSSKGKVTFSGTHRREDRDRSQVQGQRTTERYGTVHHRPAKRQRDRQG